MSWYRTRTDAELVALAAGGDRSARAFLIDRTLLPASRVAMYLQDDTDAAVQSLVTAYRDTLRRVTGLEDGGRFLPVLLQRLDANAPFPLDPHSHAPLDPVDRDRVRTAVLGAVPVGGSRRLVPMAAVLVVALLAALMWVVRTPAPRLAVTSTPTTPASGAAGSDATDQATDPGDATETDDPSDDPTDTDDPESTDEPEQTDEPEPTDGPEPTDEPDPGGEDQPELAETT